MGGGCELLWDRPSGVSKVNSRSGLVCLLVEVLDFCKKSSGAAAEVLFDFCDNMPRDVVGELLFWGVKLSKSASSGSCMDGGTLFSF